MMVYLSYVLPIEGIEKLMDAIETNSTFNNSKKIRCLLKIIYSKIKLVDINAIPTKDIKLIKQLFEFILFMFDMFKEEIQQVMTERLELAEKDAVNEGENSYLIVANNLKIFNEIFKATAFMKLNKHITYFNRSPKNYKDFVIQIN